jgi:ATP-dependent protease ClpP protease subunit
VYQEEIYDRNWERKEYIRKGKIEIGRGSKLSGRKIKNGRHLMKKFKRALDKSNDKEKMVDPGRAIFVQGDMDEALVSALTPKIIALRKNPKKPITVFIDSPGGSVGVYKTLLGLLKTPDQMGRTCLINTVATGRAFSAAAHLLASGDYIIAYPNASIRFHGIRTHVEEITAEQAGKLQDEMISIDKSTATSLAATVFNRMLLNYESVRDQMPLMREVLERQLKIYDALKGDGTIDVPAFVFYLFDKVKTPYKDLLVDCIKKTTRMCSLVKKFQRLEGNRKNLPPMVRAALKKVEKKEDETDLGEELCLFNVLLASKIRENPQWRLTTEDFSDLEQDFLQLHIMAYFQDGALDWLFRLPDLFLPPKDLNYLTEHSYGDTDDPKVQGKCEEIVSRAYGKIEPLWSFSLTLCRELMTGEHPIYPEDAWWLGLIDEVLGSPSLTRRTIRERVQESLMKKISFHDFDRFVDYEKLFN